MKSFVMAAAFGAAVLGGIASASAGILDTVKARGQVLCGVGPGLAGFGLPDQQGNWTGLDVDYCRAIASAVFNDPTKVKFVPLTAKDRFTAMQSGEVDVLIRNTTWTISRDTSLGLNFSAVNYYDGQGFLVRKKLNIKSAKELAGASICTQQGTTTELNLADFFRSNNLKYDAVVFATNDETVKAYESGRCDAFTTDASGLYAERLRLSNPDEHMVLNDIISKEPLGSSTKHGDDQWFDVVKWVHYALVTAEELGVTKANVEQMKASPNPEIKRLLGTEGEYGKAMGMGNDWAFNAIKHIGNYGEMFERNVGKESRLKIERGLNNLWSKGGLQYAPPIR